MVSNLCLVFGDRDYVDEDMERFRPNIPGLLRVLDAGQCYEY